jgi:hypothetical protein
MHAFFESRAGAEEMFSMVRTTTGIVGSLPRFQAQFMGCIAFYADVTQRVFFSAICLLDLSIPTSGDHFFEGCGRKKI